jgi:hypothetical protein
MSLTGLTDEGVELSLAVEIIQQVPHQSGRSQVDDQLTPLVLGASLVDNRHHVRISLNRENQPKPEKFVPGKSGQG